MNAFLMKQYTKTRKKKKLKHEINGLLSTFKKRVLFKICFS